MAMVIFSPSAPTALLVFRVPFPFWTETLLMPVPLMPSVKLATNSQRVDAQSAEEAWQLPSELTWHAGRVTSVAWRHKNTEQKKKKQTKRQNNGLNRNLKGSRITSQAVIQ